MYSAVAAAGKYIIGEGEGKSKNAIGHAIQLRHLQSSTHNGKYFGLIGGEKVIRARDDANTHTITEEEFSRKPFLFMGEWQQDLAESHQSVVEGGIPNADDQKGF